jgi:hypothetical protein
VDVSAVDWNNNIVDLKEPAIKKKVSSVNTGKIPLNAPGLSNRTERVFLRYYTASFSPAHWLTVTGGTAASDFAFTGEAMVKLQGEDLPELTAQHAAVRDTLVTGSLAVYGYLPGLKLGAEVTTSALSGKKASCVGWSYDFRSDRLEISLGGDG